MIDQKQYDSLLDQTLMMLSDANGGERAICGLLVAVLSELRTTREATAKLQQQFDRVSSGGNRIIAEVAQ